MVIRFNLGYFTMNTAYTIGHSTRKIEEFISLLTGNHIQLLIDVRRFPGSRRHPHFNKGNLEQSLQEGNINYRHMEILGGRRGKPEKNSNNDGWKSEGFQAYSDYINTSEVQEVINELSKLSQNTRYALMCAEALYWQCHRQLIADALVAREIPVNHILGPGQLEKHSLRDMAQIMEDKRVVYPSRQQGLFKD
ncbi:hypothetical protein Asal01_00048 [Fodinibius salicampi]